VRANDSGCYSRLEAAPTGEEKHVGAASSREEKAFLNKKLKWQRTHLIKRLPRRLAPRIDHLLNGHPSKFCLPQVAAACVLP